jgi:hypothetical protein
LDIADRIVEMEDGILARDSQTKVTPKGGIQNSKL